jgi:tetratricopeptide (TPR) repeat protein
MRDQGITLGNITRRERGFLLAIFLVALALRIVYVLQISKAPFFEQPMGDSQLYLDRAREILKGDWLGRDVFFHSSPPYPYFMALWIGFGRGALMPLYLAQALIGAANCVLIALLARRLSSGRTAVMCVAGFMAAAYGLLAFFDGDLLMIFLTLFCVDAALLLLLEARDTGRVRWAVAAGVAFGLGALDKVNLLVFAPFALWFLAAELRIRPTDLRVRTQRWNLRLAGAFLAALVLTIAPVTLRNWIVGHDLVLVSSNGGVNFFIGNNPEADGSFFAPPASGLQDPWLYESSIAVASKALGHTAKPSEASSYWTDRALRFFAEQPLAALAGIGHKAKLFLNAYEIPGQMNFYYVRSEHAPVLRWIFASFGLVAALAIAGIALGSGRASGGAARLLVVFAAVYAGTLIAFFVTERYRLPVVPILIVFAAISLVDAWDALRARRFGALAWWVGVLVLASVVVHLPQEPFRFTLSRAYDAQAQYQEAQDDARHRDELLADSIRNYRWVLEEEPQFTAARFGLALALEEAGYLDESAKELEQVIARSPEFAYAQPALRRVRERRMLGVLPPEAPLPKTPFEEARAAARDGRRDEAIRRLEALLRRDPFHSAAKAELAKLES